ncbi:hypothetical protein Tco_0233315 [Tanacetum coccineum]
MYKNDNDFQNHHKVDEKNNENFIAMCPLFVLFQRGAPFTQGTIPSIPIGGSISPEGFLSSILLLVNHALLSDPLTSGLCWWLPPKFEGLRQYISSILLGIQLGLVFLLVLLALAMVAACAFQKLSASLLDNQLLDGIQVMEACFRLWHSKDLPDLFGDELGFPQ